MQNLEVEEMGGGHSGSLQPPLSVPPAYGIYRQQQLIFVMPIVVSNHQGLAARISNAFSRVARFALSIGVG